ncbi:MAG: hypothetical protein AAF797_14110 [Planctomycetota bacterium]
MIFATLADPPYLPGVFALLQSIVDHGGADAPRRLVLVHEDPMPGPAIEGLRRIGFEVDLMARRELGDVPVRTRQVMGRFDYTFKKLLMFGLPVDEKVCFLDTDMLCLNALDGLAELPHFSAGPDLGSAEPRDVGGMPMLNSGMMVFEPGVGFRDEVLSFYRDADLTFDFGDQQVTSHYFAQHGPERVNLLPPAWNTLKRAVLAFPDRVPMDAVRFLHFVGDKPWQTTAGKLGEWRYHGMNSLWWESYERSGGASVLPAVSGRPVRGLTGLAARAAGWGWDVMPGAVKRRVLSARRRSGKGGAA